MLGDTISKIRTQAKMTQAQFSEIFGVSQQSVQKWERNDSTPGLEKLIMISKYFGVSLDALILGNDNRVVEEMTRENPIKPQYQNLADWEFYASNLLTEYNQSYEEGLDVESYKEIFTSVARLPKGEIKKKLGDVLYEVISTAKMRDGYEYIEPSDLEQIKSLRKRSGKTYEVDKSVLEQKIHGAWMGRICGCMLGRSVEGVHTDEFIPFLKETGNYPMHRYIYKSDITDEIIEKYTYAFNKRTYADQINAMPADDDLNYVVMAQKVIERHGLDFTPYNVSQEWIRNQSKDSYCTAERVAFCNFVKGYAPPQSAIYKNPYREWIGAQIRGDYFGYINPGNPERAAEMAWRDASISHVKNGIYGEMFIAAMLAIAATTSDLDTIILGGLEQIPHTSRLYEEVMGMYNAFRSGESFESCYNRVNNKYDEFTSHGWCHTNSNAMLVVLALLYGNGDYSKSICCAVQMGYDTDCNGATVGSICGMANGIHAIDEYWTKPMNNLLHTAIFGVGRVCITDCVKKTMAHIEMK